MRKPLNQTEAERLAKKLVSGVCGTMALEGEIIDNDTRQEMIRQAIAYLTATPPRHKTRQTNN